MPAGKSNLQEEQIGKEEWSAKETIKYNSSSLPMTGADSAQALYSESTEAY